MSLIDEILSTVAESTAPEPIKPPTKDEELYSPDFLELCKSSTVDSAPTQG